MGGGGLGVVGLRGRLGWGSRGGRGCGWGVGEGSLVVVGFRV